MIGKTVAPINIVEVRSPDMNAQLVAENIAAQLEKRISFRRALKQAMGRSMRLGARGIKTQVSGRLGGAEIARTEHYHEGTIPLQTLRADIDYGFAEAHTTYGRIGIKVWIYKGEVLTVGNRMGPRTIETARPRDNRERRDRRDNRDGFRGDRRDGNFRRDGGGRPQGGGSGGQRNQGGYGQRPQGGGFNSSPRPPANREGGNK
jgi:small subunit ribosomal protein S3